jgi:hypothetical protein
MQCFLDIHTYTIREVSHHPQRESCLRGPVRLVPIVLTDNFFSGLHRVKSSIQNDDGPLRVGAGTMASFDDEL